MNQSNSDLSGFLLKIWPLTCLRVFSFALLIIGWVVTGTAIAQQPIKNMSKVSYSVQQVVKRCESERAAGIANHSSSENASVRVSSQGEIELAFHAVHTAGYEEANQLEALGARVVSILEMPPELMLPPMGLIHAWVPFDTVEEAAELPWVATVMAPGRGVPNGDTDNPIQSEGIQLHNADEAHELGITGSGVIVGVISDGVVSLTDAQDREELPDVTVFEIGEGDEGTAMLEVVHDMAPDASLMFHSTGVGVAGHMAAFSSLFLAHVNIIADDISFLDEPVFQQGEIATAREALALTGIAVHSSAGNYGDKHPARVLAIGTGSGPDGIDDGFIGCTIDPTNVVAIAPDGDTTFDMIVGPNTNFGLQWSEPRAIWPTGWAGGFTDLDLYLMDETGTECLGESLNLQGGGSGDTYEHISTVDAGIPEGTHVKVVVNVFDISGAVAAPILDVHWFGKKNVSLDVSTRAGSITGDKNYTGLALSIGAVYPSDAELADSSSAGPVELTLTTVCPNDIYPCETGVAGTSATYQGLDFLGATGVSISGAGGFGSDEVCCPAEDPGDCLFFGTSAAAPHTAACEALLRSLPSFGALAPLAETRARLAATAIDYPPEGEDSITGAGLLDCLAAIGPPDAKCATPTVPTDPGVCFATGVSVDAGSSDPFGQFIMVTEDPPDPYELGITPVYLTVTDADNLEEMCVARVLVEDREPPTIIAPPNILAECESPEGTKVYIGHPESLVDNCDHPPVVTNDGIEFFPLGLSTITWTATDGSENSSTDAQDIVIVDTTPPTIVAPFDIVAECETFDGAKVNLGHPERVVDVCDESVSVMNDGVLEYYPLGLTTLTWTATDDSENAGYDTQDITVIDTTPPTIVAPPDIVTECSSPDGTPVGLGYPAVNDFCDATVSQWNDAPSLFPMGNTPVNWTAMDDSGNESNDVQDVTVQDTIPPTIFCNAPPAITPPDAPITFTVSAEEICDAEPFVEIVAYDCFAFTKKGERIDRTDGCIVALDGADITILDSGGVDDNIQWTVEATDSSGNITTDVCSLLVAHPVRGE